MALRDFVGDWFGGKPGGALEQDTEGWTVRFRAPHRRRYFSNSIYLGSSRALRAARAWRLRESRARGATANQTRVVRANGETYLEVDLDGWHMKCDLRDWRVAEQHIWCFARGAGDVERRVRPQLANGRLGQPFAERLCPRWASVAHVNRDGLDCRRANLCDGAGEANEAR